MRPLTYTALALVVALVAAAAFALPVVKAQELLSYKFETLVKVVTSEETFSATDTVTIAFIAYPRAVVYVTLTNPGSSDASATVSIDCLNKPSVTVTVPAGGTATAELELTIPTPQTNYIVCTVTADVPNITGIKLEFYYLATVELLYNETYILYKVPLFTEPYYVLGSATKYFAYFLVYPVYGSPPSGYTVTVLVNASSIATSYSDSGVSENGKAVTASGLLLNITDTLPATGRVLGHVNISASVPRIGVVVAPEYWPAFLLAPPNITKIVTAEGETLFVYLSNMTEVLSGTSPLKYNMTLVRLDRLSGIVEARANATLDGVPATRLGYVKPNGTVDISLLALVRSLVAENTWLEPVVYSAEINITKVVLNVTVPETVTAFGINVAVPNATLVNKTNTSIVVLTGVGPVVTGAPYQVDKVGSGLNVEVYLGEVLLYRLPVETYYVALFDPAGNMKAYVNVTVPTSVKLADVAYRVEADGQLNITLTLVMAIANVTHGLVIAPGDVQLAVTEELPIRLAVNLTVLGTADTLYVFMSVDEKPWVRTYRGIVVPGDVTAEKIANGVYLLKLPAAYNASVWKLNMTAALRTCVTWLGGEPAVGVYVMLYDAAGKLLSSAITDETGCAVIDPVAGTYTVRAVAYVGDRTYMTPSETVIINDDTEVALRFSVPKPVPPIEEIRLTAPSRVKPGEDIVFAVSVVLKYEALEDMKFNGYVKCTGPTEIGPVGFTIVVPKSAKAGTAIVKAKAPTAEGQYLCIARVMDYSSEPVTLQVVKVTPEEAILMQNIATWVIALVALAVAVLLTVAYLRRRAVAYIR